MSSLLHHKTPRQVSFLPLLFRNTAAQPHHPLIFSSLALFLFVSQTAFMIFFLSSSHSVSPLKGTWMGRGAVVFFDRTNRADILPWTSADAALYCTYTDLQLLRKSRHWHQAAKALHVLLLFQWRLAFTTHTIWWLLLSPPGALCAYSFITLGHGGNQTTNHARVTVTLYQLSRTESFLLAHRIIQKYSAARGPMLTRIPRPPY